MTNGGELYGEVTREISPIVNEFVQDRIRALKLPETIEGTVLALPQKRAGKNLMRPTLSYLVHRNLGGNTPLEILTPTLAISELNNMYCYLDNWILDNKNNVQEDIHKIRQITIASQILREITQATLENAEIPEEQKRRISERLAETTIRCYEGQALDLEMTVDKIAKYPTAESFLTAYMRKSELQSGHLYGLSGEIGAITASAPNHQVALARNLCEGLGKGIHISNDLGDFALFQETDGSFKPYQDQLADIINGRMTFPAYLVLTQGTKEEREALQRLVNNREASLEEKRAASKAIITSGAYEETKKILNTLYHEFKKQVHQLPKNPERNALASVGEIIRYNKYLKALKS